MFFQFIFSVFAQIIYWAP